MNRAIGEVSARAPSESDGPTPDDLLTAVAAGDERAFDLFYDRVAGMILGMARVILRDRAQAEEVTQEVFLELWRTAVRFTPEAGDAIAWAMTIAHHRTVDRVRSSQAGRRREAVAMFEAHRARPFDQVAEAVATRDEQREVRRCLASLTPTQRESIVLAYYRGLTYREIAEFLQIPPGTAKSRVRDGLIRLRDCLSTPPDTNPCERCGRF